VGTIAHLGRDLGGLTQDLEITPAVRLSRLRHAFVLTPPAVEHMP